MKIIWLPRANRELRDLFRFLLGEDRAGAVRVRTAIQEQVGTLADFPARGRVGRQPGTRELVIARTPYIVAYSVDSRIDSVIILRVIHGARRWPSDLEGLG